MQLVPEVSVGNGKNGSGAPWRRTPAFAVSRPQVGEAVVVTPPAFLLPDGHVAARLALRHGSEIHRVAVWASNDDIVGVLAVVEAHNLELAFGTMVAVSADWAPPIVSVLLTRPVPEGAGLRLSTTTQVPPASRLPLALLHVVEVLFVLNTAGTNGDGRLAKTRVGVAVLKPVFADGEREQGARPLAATEPKSCDAGVMVIWLVEVP